MIISVRYISSSANGLCYSSEMLETAFEILAVREVARLKKRGLTVWCELQDGTFYPVKGAKRSPGVIARSEER